MTNTAQSGSRSVAKDFVNNSFISVICDFIVAQGSALGRETGQALQCRALQKTAETVCMQLAFLRD
jgi:hypothetical protein